MAAEPTVVLPERAGTREQAEKLVAGLPSNLAGVKVIVDGREMAASAPSYMDELVKQVLVIRGAGNLTLLDVGHRAAGYATASAQRRMVSERLTIRIRS